MMKRKSDTFKVFGEYGLAIGTAIVLALLIRSIFWEAYRIPSEVMKPSLEPGDFIFVSKYAFGADLLGIPVWRGRTPQYGEVVTFVIPPDMESHYVKRVVGLPGDEVEVREGHLVLNGKPLEFISGVNAVCGTEKHPGYPYQICLEPPLLENVPLQRVPKDQVFLVGDLRSQNSSKQPWVVVPFRNLKGKALFIWFSVDPNKTTRSILGLPAIRTEHLFKGIH